MSDIQHKVARKLLRIIQARSPNDPLLTYRTAAQALGRDPGKNSRMVAQVCDLLDAAAALAKVPLLALVKVRESSLQVNRKAWTGNGISHQDRDAIIRRSLAYQFSKADYDAIADALKALSGRGNRAAWSFVRRLVPITALTGGAQATADQFSDAINDLGTDAPPRVPTSGMTYARDSRVRSQVLLRAAGKCEYCGQHGFSGVSGAPYLECHHIIALANDGSDRVDNVIALCPNDHREAHFGVRGKKMEEEMIAIVRRVRSERSKSAQSR
ncbi:MAG: HNH endonuclease [Gemmatimonas sp.]